MDLSLITEHLRSQLTGYKSIGQSAAYGAARAGALALPGAFVLPLRDAASAASLTGGTWQKIDQTFGVVLGTQNRRDPQGAAALDDLHTLRTGLRAALVGWVPDSTTGEPVAYRAGALLELDNELRLWWMDEFTLTTYDWST